ncbi:MAG TPA: phosphoribosylamine--glycine ligase [Clostridiales bacterium UBA8153]|nr:phosphoribosylamine--glycine ligase [Clostridiales bacterium UBA8153]
MNVLVVGGGAREHVLAAACAASPRAGRVLVAPGNPGAAEVATCFPVPTGDTAGLMRLCREEEVDLVVVGPEEPLAAGLSDLLREKGYLVFGPGRAASAVEASKAWAKAFMARHGIPTAGYRAFSCVREACRYVSSHPLPLVVKADGLAAGKGVVVARDQATALAAVERLMVEEALGRAGRTVLIEEYLEGEELSVLAITDGETIVMAPAAQDHKRAGDGDVGPNTGGMGAYSPVPQCPQAWTHDIRLRIIEPAVAGLAAEGLPYRGVLYAGLMVTKTGAKVLEFNARFGDPEAQVVLPRYSGDVLELLWETASGRLHRLRPAWSPLSMVCVVMASGGYPGSYRRGLPITGVEAAAATGARVYHAGTAHGDGGLVTAGGRVLSVVGHGPELADAVSQAYRGVEKISFAGAHYRRDIAGRALAYPGG